MEFVDYNGNDITSLITQPNDNLLINSDFRYGIINQKGQTQYIHGSGNRTYGVDNWYVTGQSSSMAINDGFLSVNLHNNGDFGCVVNIEKENEKYLTYTIMRNLHEAKSVTFDASTMNIGQDYFFNIDEDIKLGIYFWDTDYRKAWLYIKGDGIININFMKLEKGNQFTGMPAWNEAEELNKCIRKYISFIGQATMKSIYVGQRYAVLTYELPFPVHTHPRIVIPPNTGMYWQNHDSSDPVNTDITSGMVTGVAGNTVTIQLFGSFGNATWKSAYMHSVGIAFDFNEY